MIPENPSLLGHIIFKQAIVCVLITVYLYIYIMLG